MLRPIGPLRGEVALPGDKSISHRAFLLNALGIGHARVTGANPGADVASTRACLRALGVSILDRDGGFDVTGRAGVLRPSVDRLDCGNSGTTMRLLAGIVAAQSFTSTLDGDDSLRGRPMGRIATPLRHMGARVEGPHAGRRPPLIITGGELRGDRFELPVASAQLKSCVLLAAVTGSVAVQVVEPGPSRDHTERMLRAMGAPVETEGTVITLPATGDLACVDVSVPGDPSSAALVAVAVAAIAGSEVSFLNVLLNPRRCGFVDVLRRMGVTIGVHEATRVADEPTGTLKVTAANALLATTIEAHEIPALIDEVPALAVVMAQARGRSWIRGVAELRVKESDRVAAVIEMLAAFGIESAAEGDDLWIDGGVPRAPATLPASDDHRMIMAGAAMAWGCLREGETTKVVDAGPAAVSFPGFFPLVRGLADA